MESLILIPTYNEAQNIETLLDQIFLLDLDLGVVVIDDSSTDGTADLVEQLGRRNERIQLIRRTKKKSFGGSYVDGFRFAMELKPKYIFQMDADLSHPPEFISKFLENMEGHDLTIGSRYIGGIRIINWSLRRLALSLIANRYIKSVLRLPFEDCTSGFRCWNAQALKHINLAGISSNGYAFLVEMVYDAYKKGFKVKEIPIIFVERTEGDSKMSLKLIFESMFLPWRLKLKAFLRMGRHGES